MTITIETFGRASLLKRIQQRLRRRTGGFVPAGFGVTRRFAKQNRHLFE